MAGHTCAEWSPTKEKRLFPIPGQNAEVNYPKRASRPRWEEEGALTLNERTHREVERLLRDYEPSSLSQEIKHELVRFMEKEAQRYGQDHLPERDS